MLGARARGPRVVRVFQNSVAGSGMPVRCLGGRLRQTTFSAWAGGAASLLAAIKLCPFIGGGERLLLPIRKVIAQDCGALDAAVPAWRDPVSLLDRIERGRGIFRAQVGPTQNVENPGFQVVFGNRPCVMRRLVGPARGQRVARLRQAGWSVHCCRQRRSSDAPPATDRAARAPQGCLGARQGASPGLQVVR